MHGRTLGLAAALALGAAGADDPLAARLRGLSSLGSADTPRPSSDGARLAFLTTLFGSRQVATMPVEGGYPIQLTAEPEGVVAVRHSPSDAHLLAAIAVREGKRRVLLLDDQGAPATEADPSPGDQSLGGFTRDGRRLFVATAAEGGGRLALVDVDSRRVAEIGSGAPPPAPARAASPAAAPAPRVAPEKHAVPPPPGIAPPQRAAAPAADGGTPATPDHESTRASTLMRSLTGAGAPSPDGRAVLVQTTRAGDEDIWAVDVGSGTATLLTPHEGRARFRDPRWSPDGRTVYLLTDAGRDRLGVDAVSVSTRQRKPLYAPDRTVEAFAVTEDGHRIAVAEEAGGQTVFGLLELPSLRAQPLPQPPEGALAQAAAGDFSLAWTRPGDRLFFGWSQAQDTTDVFGFRVGFGTMLRLTRSPRPGLPRGSLPRAHPVAFGPTQGFLWRPAERTRPRLALMVTGTEARPVLDPRVAALAAVDVAVLRLTPRDPKGRMEEGEDAARDLLLGLRAAEQQGDLEGARPLLVASGAGAREAAILLRRAPDAFSGAVTIETNERIPGAVHVSSLAELVRAAKDKLR